MSEKRLPVDDTTMLSFAETYQTPFHLYDEKPSVRMPVHSSKPSRGCRISRITMR
jgi:hypothetical protein